MLNVNCLDLCRFVVSVCSVEKVNFWSQEVSLRVSVCLPTCILVFDTRDRLRTRPDSATPTVSHRCAGSITRRGRQRHVYIVRFFTLSSKSSCLRRGTSLSLLVPWLVEMGMYQRLSPGNHFRVNRVCVRKTSVRGLFFVFVCPTMNFIPNSIR